ncbi:helix-turn-helix domain-containing protein [Nocardioides sp. MAHUQ-72]|uniref:helix-turn-helix domain-containing protein n=1 Tax=unclassified Nocardioides TaxID=2615069 RepID=UPI00361ACCCC
MVARSSRILADGGVEHQTSGFACGLSSSPAMARAHRHDDVEVVLSLRGTAVLDLAGTVFHVGPGECAVFWAGMPHRIVETSEPDPAARGDVSLRWVTVPLVEVLGSPLLPAAFAGELLRGELLTFVAPVALEASMQTWNEEIGSEPLLTAAARREAEALLLRASHLARPDGRPAAPEESGSRALATAMASWISRHFREPVSLAQVAAVAHVHPSTAAATFRRHLGVTIGDYVSQCRIAEAQRLLISTDATTTEIAVRAGFGSTSRLYAHFADALGMPPAAYRRSMR